ncbi:MAG: PqqD family protein [Clostridiales bacterium]|nr:PqqD family protein [Clostridiales bacterium]
MKPESCWILQEIAGTSYILPYGQAIANLRHGLRVNESCAFLWEKLQDDPTRDELLNEFVRHYQATADELPQLAADLDEFLAQFQAYGILQPEHCADKKSDTTPSVHASSAKLSSDPPFIPKEFCADGSIVKDTKEQFLRIGGLTLRLLEPVLNTESVFAPEFAPFTCAPTETVEQTIEIRADETLADKTPADGIPANEIPADEMARRFPSDTAAEAAESVAAAGYGNTAPGNIMSTLIRHPQLTVEDCGTEYLLHFPQAPQIREAWLKKDGTAARFFCTLPFEKQSVTDLFHAIRIAYLYSAQKKGVFALHSASILYQGKAWLFSGPSGTGKSTHTGLWHRLFDVPVLNGDLNLLTIRDGRPIVCGLPWCGTSGISTTKDYPLGGVILLKQAKHNLCQTPEPDRQQLLLAQRFISPTWTADQLQSNLQFAGELAALAPVRILSCTKEDAAAIYMKNVIDSESL